MGSFGFGPGSSMNKTARENSRRKKIKSLKENHQEFDSKKSNGDFDHLPNMDEDILLEIIEKRLNARKKQTLQFSIIFGSLTLIFITLFLLFIN